MESAIGNGMSNNTDVLHACYRAAIEADDHYSAVLKSHGVDRWAPNTENLPVAEQTAIAEALHAKVLADARLRHAYLARIDGKP